MNPAPLNRQQQQPKPMTKAGDVAPPTPTQRVERQSKGAVPAAQIGALKPKPKRKGRKERERERAAKLAAEGVVAQ
jgi:hypothetical protein